MKCVEAKKCTFLDRFRTVFLLVWRWMRSALFLDLWKREVHFFWTVSAWYLCSCRDGREVLFFWTVSAWYLSSCRDGWEVHFSWTASAWYRCRFGDGQEVHFSWIASTRFLSACTQRVGAESYRYKILVNDNSFFFFLFLFDTSKTPCMAVNARK